MLAQEHQAWFLIHLQIGMAGSAAAMQYTALDGGAGDLEDADAPVFPPRCKRRRTGLDGGSVSHLQVVWQVGPRFWKQSEVVP